jgi:large subunit ribosomal protein L18
VSLQKKEKLKVYRRVRRVRSKLTTNVLLPRVSVFRSLKHIYAQIIDDNISKTIVGCSSMELEAMQGDKRAIALHVGRELGKRAIEKGINAVVFDRGRFKYHGRVKALADGLREGGLKV